MALTYGFFNSINGDKRYNAEQMSAIFDGIITAGIFANIGECFKVRAAENDIITVGTGKAWFNNKWILNDEPMTIKMGIADSVFNRIDAVVIEVDLNDEKRECSIKTIKGVPGAEATKPETHYGEGVYQYVLAYVYRNANSTAISDSDITNVVGTAERPYVAGLLEPNKALYIYEGVTDDEILTNLVDDDVVSSVQTYSSKKIEEMKYEIECKTARGGYAEIPLTNHPTVSTQFHVTGTAHINFVTPFKQAPFVVATECATDENRFGCVDGALQIVIQDITTSGFDIYVATNDSSKTVAGINFIVVPK